MTKKEIRRCFRKYINDLRNKDIDVWMVFEKNRISRSVMNTYKEYDGKYSGKIIMSEDLDYGDCGIIGVFNHEIGTHYLRKYN